jgi:radical SAM superfamily enzyme YgiQ (UPF0313 family)
VVLFLFPTGARGRIFTPMETTPSTHAAWYERQWPRLSAGGTWLRGGEINTIPAAEWDRRPYRILITRLSTYRDTAVSTSHLLIHAIVDGLGIYPDLAWLPPPRDGELMSQEGVPWLLGTQTKRGARDFDCLGVSLSVPQETVNLAAMLLRSGIPTDRRERLDDPGAPLVIAGGASVGAAAALYSDEGGVDGIFVGDDPAAIADLFGRCRDGRAAGLDKRAILETLRDIPGFVLPGEVAAPAVTGVRPGSADGDAATDGALALPSASAMPVSYDPSRTGIITVPVTEGCRWKCSFCYESWLHPRYRSLPGADIDQRARELKAWSGAHRADVFSFNFDMHEDIRGIIDRLSQRFDRIGLKSQRFDQLAGDPRMLELMHAVGKTSITCGMEGISDRLRAYLNKRLEDEKLRRALSAIAGAKMRQVKIFLIATGREQDDDFAEYAALLAWFKEELEGQGRRPRIIFSITPLVHFPSTPLVYETPPSPEQVAKMVRRIAITTKRAGFQVRAAARDPEAVVSQALVSGRHPNAVPEGEATPAGDARAVWRAVVGAVRDGGYVYYDAITGGFAVDFLARLARETGIGDVGVDAAPIAPPLVIGTPEEPVRRVHALSLRGLAGPAGAPDPKRANAAAAAATNAPARPPRTERAATSTVPEIRRRILTARRDRVERAFLVDLGPAAAGLPRTYMAAALGRALMLADPELVDTFKGPGTSRWGVKDFPCRIVGHDRLGLMWSAAGAVHVAGRWNGDPQFRAAVAEYFAPWGTVLGLEAADLAQPRLAFAAPFAPEGQSWLVARHLKFVQRRLPDGPGYRCEIARDSLKKKLVFDYLQRELPDGRFEVEVVPGERFEVEAFCHEAFRLPAPEEQARVTARAVLYVVPDAAPVR